MLIAALSATLGATLGAALAAQASAPSLSEPPPIRRLQAPQCVCAGAPPSDYVVLEGLVVDAEVTLAASGRAANARQATIFDVAQAVEDVAAGRTRVFHTTNAEDCGISFDYGRRYSVAVRRTEADELETDACLMRALDGR